MDIWSHCDTPRLLIRLALNQGAESVTSWPEVAMEKPGV